MCPNSPFSFSRLFGTPCAEISTALVAQIKVFNPLSGCVECQYSVRTTSLDVTDDKITDQKRNEHTQCNVVMFPVPACVSHSYNHQSQPYLCWWPPGWEHNHLNEPHRTGRWLQCVCEYQLFWFSTVAYTTSDPCIHSMLASRHTCYNNTVIMAF